MPTAPGSTCPGPIPSPGDREASRLQLSPQGTPHTRRPALIRDAGEEPRGRAGAGRVQHGAPRSVPAGAGAGIWLSRTVLQRKPVGTGRKPRALFRAGGGAPSHGDGDGDGDRARGSGSDVQAELQAHGTHVREEAGRWPSDPRGG